MTVPCTLPRSSLQLGPYDLLDYVNSPINLAAGWDRGAAVPTQSQIQASVLDGAAVVGEAAGNRSPVIPVTVHGVNRLDLARNVNWLLSFVGQQSWGLTWTPGGGCPVVFDCYRATVTVTSGIRQEDEAFAQSLQITCSALPYGRSPDPVTIRLAGAPVQVEAFDSAPLPALIAPVIRGAAVADSPAFVTSPAPDQGSHALSVHLNSPSAGTYEFGFDISKAGVTIPVADDQRAIELSLRQDGAAVTPWPWQITITLTLDDGTVVTTSRATASVRPTRWYRLVVWLPSNIPAGATITSWDVTAEISQGVSNTAYAPHHLYFDNLLLLPAAGSGVSDGQGAVLTLNGVQGTARTPIALNLTQVAGSSFKSWLVHSAPSDGLAARALITLGGAPTPAVYITDNTVRYGGVYDVWVVASAVASAGTARTWTVSTSAIFPAYSTTAVSVAASVTPAANQLIYVGSIVLPGTQLAPEADYLNSFTVTSSLSGDSFNDLLLLDTRGQTLIVDSNAPAHTNVWVDAPDPTVALGGIYSGTSLDRSDAASVTAHVIRAGVLLANPGDAALLLYSPEGALQGTATYYPRWQQDATS